MAFVPPVTDESPFVRAMKREAVDPRRCVIAKVTPEGLAELLAGRVGCVNFPHDGRITGTVFDLASNSVMLRIEAAQFPVVPQFERFPDFGLLFRTVETREPVLSCAVKS